jgi:HSP20 family protein
MTSSTPESTVPTPVEQQQKEAPAQENTRAEESYVLPPVDIYEDDQGLMILVDFPGVEPGSLDVRIDRGVLTIQGRAKQLAKADPIYREFELTGFFRQFRLPDEIDEEHVEAELRHGVLRLRLRRSERAQPRRIDVRASQ